MKKKFTPLKIISALTVSIFMVTCVLPPDVAPSVFNFKLDPSNHLTRPMPLLTERGPAGARAELRTAELKQLESQISPRSSEGAERAELRVDELKEEQIRHNFQDIFIDSAVRKGFETIIVRFVQGDIQEGEMKVIFGKSANYKNGQPAEMDMAKIDMSLQELNQMHLALTEGEKVGFKWTYWLGYFSTGLKQLIFMMQEQPGKWTEELQRKLDMLRDQEVDGHQFEVNSSVEKDNDPRSLTGQKLIIELIDTTVEKEANVKILIQFFSEELEKLKQVKKKRVIKTYIGGTLNQFRWSNDDSDYQAVVGGGHLGPQIHLKITPKEGKGISREEILGGLAEPELFADFLNELNEKSGLQNRAELRADELRVSAYQNLNYDSELWLAMLSDAEKSQASDKEMETILQTVREWLLLPNFDYAKRRIVREQRLRALIGVLGNRLEVSTIESEKLKKLKEWLEIAEGDVKFLRITDLSLQVEKLRANLESRSELRHQPMGLDPHIGIRVRDGLVLVRSEVMTALNQNPLIAGRANPLMKQEVLTSSPFDYFFNLLNEVKFVVAYHNLVSVLREKNSGNLDWFLTHKTLVIDQLKELMQNHYIVVSLEYFQLLSDDQKRTFLMHEVFHREFQSILKKTPFLKRMQFYAKAYWMYLTSKKRINQFLLNLGYALYLYPTIISRLEELFSLTLFHPEAFGIDFEGNITPAEEGQSIDAIQKGHEELLTRFPILREVRTQSLHTANTMLSAAKKAIAKLPRSELRAKGKVILGLPQSAGYDSSILQETRLNENDLWDEIERIVQAFEWTRGLTGITIPTDGTKLKDYQLIAELRFEPQPGKLPTEIKEREVTITLLNDWNEVARIKVPGIIQYEEELQQDARAELMDTLKEQMNLELQNELETYPGLRPSQARERFKAFVENKAAAERIRVGSKQSVTEFHRQLWDELIDVSKSMAAYWKEMNFKGFFSGALELSSIVLRFFLQVNLPYQHNYYTRAGTLDRIVYSGKGHLFPTHIVSMIVLFGGFSLIAVWPVALITTIAITAATWFSAEFLMKSDGHELTHVLQSILLHQIERKLIMGRSTNSMSNQDFQNLVPFMARQRPVHEQPMIQNNPPDSIRMREVMDDLFRELESALTKRAELRESITPKTLSEIFKNFDITRPENLYFARIILVWLRMMRITEDPLFKRYVKEPFASQIKYAYFDIDAQNILTTFLSFDPAQGTLQYEELLKTLIDRIRGAFVVVDGKLQFDPNYKKKMTSDIERITSRLKSKYAKDRVKAQDDLLEFAVSGLSPLVWDQLDKLRPEMESGVMDPAVQKSFAEVSQEVFHYDKQVGRKYQIKENPLSLGRRRAELRAEGRVILLIARFNSLIQKYTDLTERIRKTPNLEPVLKQINVEEFREIQQLLNDFGDTLKPGENDPFKIKGDSFIDENLELMSQWFHALLQLFTAIAVRTIYNLNVQGPETIHELQSVLGVIFETETIIPSPDEKLKTQINSAVQLIKHHLVLVSNAFNRWLKGQNFKYEFQVSDANLIRLAGEMARIVEAEKPLLWILLEHQEKKNLGFLRESVAIIAVRILFGVQSIGYALMRATSDDAKKSISVALNRALVAVNAQSIRSIKEAIEKFPADQNREVVIDDIFSSTISDLSRELPKLEHFLNTPNPHITNQNELLENVRQLGQSITGLSRAELRNSNVIASEAKQSQHSQIASDVSRPRNDEQNRAELRSIQDEFKNQLQQRVDQLQELRWQEPGYRNEVATLLIQLGHGRRLFRRTNLSDEEKREMLKKIIAEVDEFLNNPLAYRTRTLENLDRLLRDEPEDGTGERAEPKSELRAKGRVILSNPYNVAILSESLLHDFNMENETQLWNEVSKLVEAFEWVRGLTGINIPTEGTKFQGYEIYASLHLEPEVGKKAYEVKSRDVTITLTLNYRDVAIFGAHGVIEYQENQNASGRAELRAEEMVVEIQNKQGIHMRPVEKIMMVTTAFEDLDISVRNLTKEGEWWNAKLGLTMLALDASLSNQLVFRVQPKPGANPLSAKRVLTALRILIEDKKFWEDQSEINFEAPDTYGLVRMVNETIGRAELREQKRWDYFSLKTAFDQNLPLIKDDEKVRFKTKWGDVDLTFLNDISQYRQYGRVAIYYFARDLELAIKHDLILVDPELKPGTRGKFKLFLDWAAQNFKLNSQSLNWLDYFKIKKVLDEDEKKFSLWNSRFRGREGLFKLAKVVHVKNLRGIYKSFADRRERLGWEFRYLRTLKDSDLRSELRSEMRSNVVIASEAKQSPHRAELRAEPRNIKSQNMINKVEGIENFYVLADPLFDLLDTEKTGKTSAVAFETDPRFKTASGEELKTQLLWAAALNHWLPDTETLWSLISKGGVVFLRASKMFETHAFYLYNLLWEEKIHLATDRLPEANKGKIRKRLLDSQHSEVKHRKMMLAPRNLERFASTEEIADELLAQILMLLPDPNLDVYKPINFEAMIDEIFPEKDLANILKKMKTETRPSKQEIAAVKASAEKVKAGLSERSYKDMIGDWIKGQNLPDSDVIQAVVKIHQQYGSFPASLNRNNFDVLDQTAAVSSETRSELRRVVDQMKPATAQVTDDMRRGVQSLIGTNSNISSHAATTDNLNQPVILGILPALGMELPDIVSQAVQAITEKQGMRVVIFARTEYQAGMMKSLFPSEYQSKIENGEILITTRMNEAQILQGAKRAVLRVLGLPEDEAFADRLPRFLPNTDLVKRIATREEIISLFGQFAENLRSELRAAFLQATAA